MNKLIYGWPHCLTRIEWWQCRPHSTVQSCPYTWHSCRCIRCIAWHSCLCIANTSTALMDVAKAKAVNKLKRSIESVIKLVEAWDNVNFQWTKRYCTPPHPTSPPRAFFQSHSRGVQSAWVLSGEFSDPPFSRLPEVWSSVSSKREDLRVLSDVSGC